MARFAAWIGIGIIFAFGLLTSLWFVLLPIGFLALIVMAFTGTPSAQGGDPPGRRGAIFGLVAGLGLACLLLALLNTDYQPCDSSGAIDAINGHSVGQCGGINPVPWSIAGVALLALGAGGFFIRRHRASGLPHSSIR